VLSSFSILAFKAVLEVSQKLFDTVDMSSLVPFFAIAGFGMQRDWRPLIPALSIALVMLTHIFTRPEIMGM
jgi:hypothetical protein